MEHNWRILSCLLTVSPGHIRLSLSYRTAAPQKLSSSKSDNRTYIRPVGMTAATYLVNLFGGFIRCSTTHGFQSFFQDPFSKLAGGEPEFIVCVSLGLFIAYQICKSVVLKN